MVYLARICRPDILWSVNKFARTVTKWTRVCDKCERALLGQAAEEETFLRSGAGIWTRWRIHQRGSAHRIGCRGWKWCREKCRKKCVRRELWLKQSSMQHEMTDWLLRTIHMSLIQRVCVGDVPRVHNTRKMCVYATRSVLATRCATFA